MHVFVVCLNPPANTLGVRPLLPQLTDQAIRNAPQLVLTACVVESRSGVDRFGMLRAIA